MATYRRITLLIAVLLLPSVLAAQEVTVTKSADIVDKKGRSFYKHRLKEGHTLEAISRAYEIPQRVIAKFNQDVMLSQELDIRQMLVPVYYPPKEFITHKLKRKQTLFYVSKKYDISREILYKHNPQAKEEVERGDELKIPVEIKQEKENVQPRDSMYIYVVKAENESLYYIAKKFGVRIERLIDINEGVMWYPEPGDSIRVPVKEATKLEEKEKEKAEAKNVCEDYVYDGEQLKVALLFPFRTEVNYQEDTARNKSNKIRLTDNTDKIFQYYQGIQMALDTMRRKNISFEVFVYDTQNSEYRARQIMHKSEMKDMDLIIGPAYSKPFAAAAKIAKNKEIAIAAPLSRKHDYLDNNPYVIKIKPHESSYIRKMAQYLAKYWDQNFVVLHDDSFRERERLKMLRDELVDAFTGNRKINDVVYKEVNLRDREMKAIEEALAPHMNNIVIIPSSHEPFVTDVINKLHFLYEKYNIWVAGMSEWAEFRGINLEYFHQLQVHYCDFLFFDYDNAKVKRICRHFNRVYGYDPTAVTLEAFEVSYMLFNQLVKYGPDIYRCIDETEIEYPHNARFRFEQYKRMGGMENKGSYIIRYTTDFYKEIHDPNLIKDYFKHRSDTILQKDVDVKPNE